MFLLPDTRLGYWVTCLLILTISFYILGGVVFVVGEEADFAYNLMCKIAAIIPDGFITIFEDGSWRIDQAPIIHGCLPGMPCTG